MKSNYRGLYYRFESYTTCKAKPNKPRSEAMEINIRKSAIAIRSECDRVGGKDPQCKAYDTIDHRETHRSRIRIARPSRSRRRRP